MIDRRPFWFGVEGDIHGGRAVYPERGRADGCAVSGLRSLAVTALRDHATARPRDQATLDPPLLRINSGYAVPRPRSRRRNWNPRSDPHDARVRGLPHR